MKRITLRLFVITIFLAKFSTTNAQDMVQDSVLVSQNATLFANQLRNINLTSKNSNPIAVKISEKKTFQLKKNVEQEDENKIRLIGTIVNEEKSSFSFTLKKGKLTGYIISIKNKEAYRIFTTKNNHIYSKRVDINTILCIDFNKEISTKKNSKDSNNKSTQSAKPLLLQSRPSATSVIYLDFDGEDVVGSNWNGGGRINAAPSGLSDNQIRTVWEIVSEDFSPFNINVVTDRSVFDATPKRQRIMCVFTPTDTAAPNTGGVAFLGSFAWNSDNPCWVYNLGTKSAGDTASHELGHTMGLRHDGKGGTEYYRGHNEWAPIMGSSSSSRRPISQWSRGEYANASNTENDLQIIASISDNFGFVEDNHGDTIDTATTLIADVGGNASRADNFGIISKRNDVDIFSFLTLDGTATFNILPHDVFPNLDIKVSLLDENGNEIESSNPNGLSASISANLEAGLYFLEIQGVGSGTVDNGYSDYASLGKYSISGTYAVKTPENDLQLISITPEKDSFFCGSIAPTAKIKNGGLNTVSGFNVTYRIDDNPMQTQVFTNVILSTQEITINLNPIILNTAGQANIEITVQSANDDLPTNNKIIHSFFGNTSGITGQVNSFENETNNLLTYNSTDEDLVWERGVPTGNLLNTASSGSNVYATNLDGNYSDKKQGFLITSCYDLSLIENPVLKFNMAYDIEINFDVLYVEYSLDSGENWTLLGTKNSLPNWYNSDRKNSPNRNDCQLCPGGQWTGRNTTLTEYAYDFTQNASTDTDLTKADNIMFRFVFHTDDFENNEGVIIDDLVIDGQQLDDDDDDNDGILDDVDNCPLTANANQLDTDNDGIGDVCDDDDDNDGIPDTTDNCPLTVNPDQQDTDGDGLGDACENPNDIDNDGIINTEDNCPETPNPNQEDSDGDNIGDVCDDDDDNDTILDTDDNCPLIANTDQLDTDNDGIGNVCDNDNDNDGILNDVDNCPLIANSGQEDTDGDGIGNACDTDDDNDTILDNVDNCPLIANTDQLDTDNDGIGNVCDNDDDNDTILDNVDNCPLTANTEQLDSDNDGIGNACDNDIDGDGVNNTDDICNNTPLGAIVNTLGCEILIPTRDDFVLTNYVSCSTKKGEISIETIVNNNYNVSLTQNGNPISKTFTGTTSFDDLETGEYELCFSIVDFNSFEECFTVVLEEPEEFLVETEVNRITNELTIFLSGGDEYTIILNDETTVTTNSEVILPLTKIANKIQVSSGRDCDTNYEDAINLIPSIFIYPNPTTGLININLEGVFGSEAEVSIYSVNGSLIFKQKPSIIDGKIEIDISKLHAGTYILNVIESGITARQLMIKK